MDIYLVGGAVRDELLGYPVEELAWVVVGAHPEDLLAQGYRQVGKDFPVFLHPETKEEYALARTERKQGHGYAGFEINAAPDVTLEQDLERRDLTINAIARDAAGNEGRCTFTVILDREDPVVECPPDVVYSTDAGARCLTSGNAAVLTTFFHSFHTKIAPFPFKCLLHL